MGSTLLPSIYRISRSIVTSSLKLTGSFFNQTSQFKYYTTSNAPSDTSYPIQPRTIPFPKIFQNLSRIFPRPLSSSWDDYRAFKTNEALLQEDLLSTVPFYPDSADGKIGQIIKTPIDDENYINEFCITPLNPNSDRMNHLVFIHGYGAGLGFFIKNFETLPLLDDSWTIHVVDMPGYGFSSRKPFPFDIRKHTLSAVEQWFVDRFELWFQKRGLAENSDRNLLVAHSMGAYFSALYAHRHPKRFKKLIMCSPAGVFLRKLIDEPQSWFVKLWDRNVSPFSLIRNSGRWGSKIASAWSYRRFGRLLDDGTELGATQFEALHRYSYAIFNRPGSGEYMLSFVLQCGANPRHPLLTRFFSEQPSEEYTADCDWLWLYGDRDWMDYHGGELASKFINEHKKNSSDIKVVPDAGHHLYFDNYEYFNELLVNEMRNVMKGAS
ncbi:HBL018Wp [Eremothecium sinecaudum]|uniref:HBL018Wp n=1 Tax=Eremothecium sinecaudum TaxID=45286 RepID=A0A120K104_9SACH|nr:HBL018Wp [Eremothecium sinecaudum]AMD18884.1 HBL018Wp [Eremothecium sinecaudum]